MKTDVKNELIIVRMLDAPCARVWQAFLEPEALREWWGLPNGAGMPTCRIDFRVGGALHCEIVTPDGTRLWFRWNYREIVEGAWLAMEQHASDAEGRELDSRERPVSTITVRFEAVDGKTKLTITQTGMASHVHRVEDYEQGWSESLARLADSLPAS